MVIKSKKARVLIREVVGFEAEQNRFAWDHRHPRYGLTFVCCVGGETALVGLHGRLWQLTGVNSWIMRMTFPYLYFVWKEYDMHSGYPIREGVTGVKNYLACRICQERPHKRRDFCEWTRAVNVHHLLLRLQRWTRRILWYRKVAIPVLMSQHSRLGRDSSLGRLDFDVLMRLVLPCTHE